MSSDQDDIYEISDDDAFSPAPKVKAVPKPKGKPAAKKSKTVVYSSEGEDIDLNVSGSEGSDDGYAPAAKKAKAPPKSKATAPKSKAEPKKAVATKSKPAAKKKNLPESDDDMAQDAALDEDVVMDEIGSAAPKVVAKKKTASETYTKLTQLEHILKRPDSYIGSVETVTQPMWTYDSDTNRMVNREVKYVPGFFKIVDEILVNAADNKINDPNMDTLKITIDPEENTISVYNNGKGIPIEMHSKEKMYIPELIFGHLLSSSNYDDDEKKLTGGRNGYGAKLANIYSHEFTVETADKKSKQRYKQTWTKNMSQVGKAKITSNARGEEYTQVSFKPDLARFHMDSIDDDTLSLLKKRVYDLAGTIKDVKVYLNGERLKIKSFKSYVDMYLESVAAEAAEVSGGAAQPKPTLIYEKINERWEVGFALSEGSFQHVAFANSISTTKGGTHVNVIADQIAKELIATISKKNKAATVKAAQIKNHMWLFVNALIENPTFDSQTKETLTLQASKFGSRPKLSEDFFKKLQKSELIERVLNWAKFKADQQIKKTDGSKRTRLTGMTKLSDANNAGGRNASNCTLILTEGDSAKALAVAGLGVVGRDNFGVFPLRGKLLNVREARHDQIMKNEEIQNIKKIMGLQHNKDYSSVASLRYGRLMIMTDQDHDGSHIKGLLINFLDHFFPSLLKIPDFLVEFVTPIVRVTKGNQRKNFFTIPEYEKWLEETPDAHKWTSKYYKGLGTSTDADARDYFGNMQQHMIPFAPTQEGDKELIDLAFSKKKADDRKEWLRQFVPGTYLDHRLEEIPYSEFINKELILFSMADNIRSIPSVADGLKPGQRKVIWGVFKRKLKKEIKVAQLVGYISEHAAYHHGEQSLTMTIVNLAQDYVGSNNINLLKPNGQYGTRDQGGKDHASARYIFTEPSPIARTIFHPADDPLLNQQKDDNQLIEPEFYLPILPMVLVNGADGIGTGWSTNVPCYNPEDIVANIRRLMNDEEMIPMLPWWRDYAGQIKVLAKNKYEVTGTVNKLDDTRVEIRELPIYEWTQTYKAKLEAMIGEKGDGPVKDYKEYHDNTNVHFVVTMKPEALKAAEEQGLVEYFKLSTKISTTNMMCFDTNGKIKKYESAEEIMEEFYPIRLAYYQKRKEFLAKELQDAFEKLSNQARFVKMIVSKELSVSNRKKADIVAQLRKLEFRPFPKIARAKAAGETEPVAEEEDEDEEEDEETSAKQGGGNSTDYDYLLNMAISSLTREKIEKLNAQANEKEQELLTLLGKSPKELWNADLDDFLVQYRQLNAAREASRTTDSKGRKVKKRQAVLETRKSIGKKRSADSDDDFIPIKAPAAPKKAAASESKAGPAKASNGKSTKKAIKDESDNEREAVKKKPTARKVSGKKVKEESDNDSDVVVKPQNGKGKAKEPPKRKSTDFKAASDDEDVIVRPAKKRKPTQSEVTDFFSATDAGSSSKPVPRKEVQSKTKAPPESKSKKTAVKVDGSDDDMDFDEIPAPPPRAAPKRTVRAGTTKKYVISEDDEDDDGLYDDDDE